MLKLTIYLIVYYMTNLNKFYVTNKYNYKYDQSGCVLINH